MPHEHTSSFQTEKSPKHFNFDYREFKASLTASGKRESKVSSIAKELSHGRTHIVPEKKKRDKHNSLDCERGRHQIKQNKDKRQNSVSSTAQNGSKSKRKRKHSELDPVKYTAEEDAKENKRKHKKSQKTSKRVVTMENLVENKDYANRKSPANKKSHKPSAESVKGKSHNDESSKAKKLIKGRKKQLKEQKRESKGAKKTDGIEKAREPKTESPVKAVLDKKPKAPRMSQNISTEQDDMIHTNWKLSRNDIMSLKSKGIFIKKGKWSPSEDRLLRQNMEDYLQQHRISDPSVLLFAHKEADKEEGRRWKQFASNTGFYKQLAKGLCREVFLVYRRARRIYDQDNYKGQFSEEEIKELIRLHGIYGNDWRKIGDIMGRSAQSVDHRFQLLEGNKGNWTDEEVDCLIEGVRAVSGTVQGEPCYNQIYWNAVASYVKTRNPTQCRAKWLNGTLWKDASSKPLKWTEKDDYELISKVYYSSVTTECDIDWHAIAEDFQHARSPAFLQHRWWLVKMRYCGKDIIKDRDFEELLDFLYNVKGESLRVKHFKVCEKATNSL